MSSHKHFFFFPPAFSPLTLTNARSFHLSPCYGLVCQLTGCHNNGSFRSLARAKGKFHLSQSACEISRTSKQIKSWCQQRQTKDKLSAYCAVCVFFKYFTNSVWQSFAWSAHQTRLLCVSLRWFKVLASSADYTVSENQSSQSSH